MNIMRCLLLAVFLSLVAIPLRAQDGLNINSLFDGRYRANPAASETIIQGSRLSRYDLKNYHALTLTGVPDAAYEIERLVSKDGAKALSREVSYKQGRLYYGFYRLASHNGLRRYLFYLNQHLKGGNKIILIYLDGDADTEAIKRMLKK